MFSFAVNSAMVSGAADSWPPERGWVHGGCLAGTF